MTLKKNSIKVEDCCLLILQHWILDIMSLMSLRVVPTHHGLYDVFVWSTHTSRLTNVFAWNTHMSWHIDVFAWSTHTSWHTDVFAWSTHTSWLNDEYFVLFFFWWSLIALLLDRSIEELQKQNQKLLAGVRELSDAQEEKEMQCGDTK